MKFDWVDPKTLKLHPKNCNRHSPEQIQQLIKIIKAFGWRHPIIVSTFSKCIVAGEGRTLAALEAKIESVPIHYQDFTDEAEEIAFMIADNQIQKWSQMDYEQLNIIVPEIGPFDLDLLCLKGFELNACDKKPKKELICPKCGHNLST